MTTKQSRRLSLFKSQPKPDDGDWWFEAIEKRLEAKIPPCPAGFNPELLKEVIDEILELACRTATMARLLGADIPPTEGMRPTPPTGRRLIQTSNLIYMTEVYDAKLAAQHQPEGTANAYRLFGLRDFLLGLDVEASVRKWEETIAQCQQIGAVPITILNLTLSFEPNDASARDPATSTRIMLTFEELPIYLHPERRAQEEAGGQGAQTTDNDRTAAA